MNSESPCSMECFYSFWFLYRNHIFFDRIELQNVWGHVNMYARGAGQAVAQLDVNYGVDFEPFKVNDHVALCL